MNKLLSSILLLTSLCMCSHPQSGPDKTVAGAVLGAGWGAGTGAIVGNQIGNVSGGAAAGAGIGLVAGALTGGGYDVNEGILVEQQRKLDAMKMQNEINGARLEQMQAKLDRARPSTTSASLYQVYFDNDVSSIKAGAVADLEQIANSLKTDPAAKKIMVIGHSDDGGTPEYNERLAEARARTVTAYLASQGLSMDKLVTQQYGSQRPVASNSSPEGRQLNRRVEILVTN